MKRITKSMLGVTLLEIMLVLAVAAMIIVMSVRYYQSANASQQANQTLQLIQAITASADALAQGGGSYVVVTTPSITPLLANVGGLKLPWGADATITTSTATSYTVKLDAVPAGVCGLVVGRLVGDTHFTGALLSDCSGTTKPISYTYTPNPATAAP